MTDDQRHNQIGRGTYASIVWFHDVPQDAFDLLPFKATETESCSGCGCPCHKEGEPQ